MPFLDTRSERGSRVGVALVAVLVLVVVVGTAAAYVNFQHRVADATSGAAPTLPDQSAMATPDPVPTPAAPDVVSLWIGDGYTSGSGADTPQSGEACAAATDLGWTCELDAERGTGFLSDGHTFDTSYGTLADRLADGLAGLDPAHAPDVVVVDAGRNDLGVFSDAAIATAMGDFARKLHRAYPSAVLIQVVPWTLGQDAPVPEMSATITRLMTKYDGYVVDPYAEGWAGAGKTDLDSLRTPAGASNQAGHDLIGQQLASSIRALDLPVSTARG